MDTQDFNQIFNEYKQQGVKQTVLSTNEETELGKEKIIAVRKNDEGDIIAFKTENGRELDYVTTLNEAKAGMIAHVDVFHKYGRDIIRSEPDGIKENNLDQLPLF